MTFIVRYENLPIHLQHTKVVQYLCIYKINQYNFSLLLMGFDSTSDG